MSFLKSVLSTKRLEVKLMLKASLQFPCHFPPHGSGSYLGRNLEDSQLLWIRQRRIKGHDHHLRATIWKMLCNVPTSFSHCFNLFLACQKHQDILRIRCFLYREKKKDIYINLTGEDHHSMARKQLIFQFSWSCGIPSLFSSSSGSLDLLVLFSLRPNISDFVSSDFHTFSWRSEESQICIHLDGRIASVRLETLLY